MPVAIQAAQQKSEESTLDKVLKGLQIAGGIIQIPESLKNIQKANQDIKAKQQEQQFAMEENKRLRKGIIGGKERISFAEKGLQQVDPSTKGATSFQVETEPGKYETQAFMKTPAGGALTEFQRRSLAIHEKRLAKDFNPNKLAFENLPEENKVAITDLGKQNANKTSIVNQIDATFNTLTDEKLSDDQKIAAGRQLLKTLNSTEGKDAVGAEEAKRLGSFLEFKIGNITEPGSFIGRDLDQFNQQVANISDNIKSAIKYNQEEIQKLYGKSSGDKQLLSQRLNNKVDGVLGKNIEEMTPKEVAKIKSTPEFTQAREELKRLNLQNASKLSPQTKGNVGQR